MDIEDFRKYGKEMIDFICEYKDNVMKYDVVPKVRPGYLKKLLPGEPPQQQQNFEKIFQDFETKIIPGLMHWNHPQFFGSSPSGSSYPSILGDMLSSAIASIGFSWASCPAATELEAIVLDWYAKALGLPEAFLNDSLNGGGGGGSLQGSSSECTLVCMLTARTRVIQKLRQNMDSTVHESIFLPELVAYTSKEAHSSVFKAAKIALVKLRLIESDHSGSMPVDLLEQAIKNDMNAGLVPFFVGATLGTTGACAFDNLTEIGKVCRLVPSIWFHVDGAYAGNSFILPEMREFSEGLEYADSFNTSPNKLLLVNFDVSAMWVRDVFSLKSTFNVDPLYLQHSHDNAIDFRHYGIPLSRRFRALKLWFLFRSYGLSGLRNHVRNHIAMAKVFENLLLSDERFKVCNKVHLGVVCFCLHADERFTKELLKSLNESGKIRLELVILEGRQVIRFCVGHEHITKQDIVEAWKTIKTVADKILYTQRLQINVIPSKAVVPKPHPITEKTGILTQLIMATILCTSHQTFNSKQGSP